MDVYNERTARELGRSWMTEIPSRVSATRVAQMLYRFAADQRVCAQLETGENARRGYLAAARELERQAAIAAGMRV